MPLTKRRLIDLSVTPDDNPNNDRPNGIGKLQSFLNRPWKQGRTLLPYTR